MHIETFDLAGRAVSSLKKSIIPLSQSTALGVPANDTAFQFTDSGDDNYNKHDRENLEAKDS